jgi:integrase
MAAINFTASFIQHMKPTDVRTEYWDSGVTGLGIRISPSGRKTWFFFYRFKGRSRRYTIGTFPSISLADAREHTRKLELNLKTQGEDPASLKQENRKAQNGADLVSYFIENYAKRKKKSWRKDEKMLRADFIPRFKHHKLKDIHKRDIIGLIEKVIERGSPIQANRVFAVVRKMFNFAIEEDLIDFSPCYGISLRSPEKQRDRVLEGDELRKLWTVLSSEKSDTSTMLKIMLLTGQRGGEVSSMEWNDIKIESNVWVIPASKAKNGLEHRVPLSNKVLEIINSIKAIRKSNRWVFPSPTTHEHIRFIHKAVDRIRQLTGFHFTPHDLRRTAASRMASIGVPRLTIKKLLNHVDRDITAIYDRYSYDTEKQNALSKWQKQLELICLTNDLNFKMTAN